MPERPESSLNLPYEAIPGDPVTLDDQFYVSAGVILRGALLPDPYEENGEKHLPAILLDFPNAADGRMHLPTILLCPPNDGDLDGLVANLTDLVNHLKAVS